MFVVIEELYTLVVAIFLCNHDQFAHVYERVFLEIEETACISDAFNMSAFNCTFQRFDIAPEVSNIFSCFCIGKVTTKLLQYIS